MSHSTNIVIVKYLYLFKGDIVITRQWWHIFYIILLLCLIVIKTHLLGNWCELLCLMLAVHMNFVKNYFCVKASCEWMNAAPNLIKINMLAVCFCFLYMVFHFHKNLKDYKIKILSNKAVILVYDWTIPYTFFSPLEK